MSTSQQQSVEAAHHLASHAADMLNTLAPAYVVLAESLEKQQENTPSTMPLGEVLTNRTKALGRDGINGLKLARQIEQLRDSFKGIVPPSHNPYFVWPILRHLSESIVVLLDAKTTGDLNACALLPSHSCRQWMEDKRVREWMHSNLKGQKMQPLFGRV